MTNFTKKELEDIEVVYRAFCGDGRILTYFEQAIMNKLKLMINTTQSNLHVYTNHPHLCPHDYQPASVSQWGHQFNQCINCGEIE